MIEPGVQLLGATRIGARCTIRTGSILQDTRALTMTSLSARTPFSIPAVWPQRLRIGPFSRLRPGTDIRAGAHVGSFVEMKNTVLHEGAKAPHLSYLGDATIGPRQQHRRRDDYLQLRWCGQASHRNRQSRFHRQRHRARRSRPRRRWSLCGHAGSVITDNVPADALAIGRGRQVNKAWLGRRPPCPNPLLQQASRSQIPLAKISRRAREEISVASTVDPLKIPPGLQAPVAQGYVWLFGRRVVF